MRSSKSRRRSCSRASRVAWAWASRARALADSWRRMAKTATKTVATAPIPPRMAPRALIKLVLTVPFLRRLRMLCFTLAVVARVPDLAGTRPNSGVSTEVNSADGWTPDRDGLRFAGYLAELADGRQATAARPRYLNAAE